MVQLDNVIYDHNLSSTQSSVFQLETMNELKEFIIQLGTKRINLPILRDIFRKSGNFLTLNHTCDNLIDQTSYLTICFDATGEETFVFFVGSSTPGFLCNMAAELYCTVVHRSLL